MDPLVEKFRRKYPDVIQVKEQFKLLDANNDGQICKEEMEKGLTADKDFSKDQANFLFTLADTNEDGVIDISEFVHLFFPSAKEAIANLRKNFKGPEDVANRFQSWDTNKDGKLSFEELNEAASKDAKRFLTEEDMNAIFIVGDLNLDGEIDESEFQKLMIPSVHDIVAKFRYAYRSVEDVKKVFQSIDLNGDGALDKKELHKALTNYKFQFSDQEVDIVFKEGDVDGDGEINFEEFMYLMCPDTAQIIKKFRESYKQINDVKGAFRKFDKNRDGQINKSELARMMFSSGHSFTDMEVDAVMNLADKDGDGEIDLEEFLMFMTPSTSATLNKIRMDITCIDEVKGLFKAIDADGDGLLTKEEMMNSPNCRFDREEVTAIYELGDSNGDGVLDMGEFIAIMYPAAGEAISKLSKNYPNIEEVKLLFRKLDLDNDGSITKVEMRENAIRFSEQEIDSIFALGDINDDGALDLEEFIGVMYPSAATVAGRLRAKYTDINLVKKAFASIDTNGDGKVSKQEMAENNIFNNQEIDALFILGDSNNDGEIDLEEFIGVLYPVAAQALAKIASTIHNIDDARFVFKQMDGDGDGLLSQEELRKSWTRFSPAEIEALFAIADINGDGEIDVHEFINVMCPNATTVITRIKEQFKSEDQMSEIFAQMDLDGDGQISQSEMMKAGKFNEQQVNALFELGDADRDGVIDLQEFIKVMQTSSPAPYTEAGDTLTIGNLEVYKVGSGPKCIIWCHDCKGFSADDRTRQLVDKMAVSGFTVVLPDFFLGLPPLRETDKEDAWLAEVSDWGKIREFWVEKLLPYLRDEMGIKAIGVVGTGWGSWVATRLSSYGEVLACVNVQPLISSAVEAAKEDMYEVLEEVSCPQLMLSCRNNCPNEKPGGLASNVFNASPFGKQCEFEELNMLHGFLLEGDRSVEDIAVTVRVTINRTLEFLNKYLHYDGEPVPISDEELAKHEEDFDLKSHTSDSCRTCLEIRHQADKAAARTL